MTSVESLSKQWRLFKNVFDLTNQWDCRRGILFKSEDQAETAAAAIGTAELLNPDATITIDCATVTAEEFKKQIDFLQPKEHQESMFDPRPKKPCVIVLNLDVSTPPVWVGLKWLFEHGKTAACFLATARSIDKEHRSIASFFATCERLRG